MYMFDERHLGVETGGDLEVEPFAGGLARLSVIPPKPEESFSGS